MKRKHMVVMIGGYYPMMSPGSLILCRLVDIWKYQYNVTLVASRNITGLKKREVCDGVEIFRVYDFNRLINNELEKKIANSPSSLEREFFSVLMTLKKGLYYGYRVIRRESLIYTLSNRLEKTLEQIHKQKEIDILISCVDPHENNAAAYTFMNRHADLAKWYIYQLDRFANANSLYELSCTRKAKEKRHLQREKNYLKTCDALFLLNPLRTHYNQPYFEKYQSKIIATDHPLLTKPSCTFEKNVSQTVRLIYGGSFDRVLRNPEYALDFIGRVSEYSAVRWDIYAFGNCDAIVQYYKKHYPEAIYPNQRISRDQLVGEIGKSDMLVSIGNNSESEVPSKIFDYLSYGLPIIHFFYSVKDPVLPYLRRVKHALCLEINDSMKDEQVQSLAAFIKKYRGFRMAFPKIKEIFPECTPEFVEDMFEKEFNRD